jgi:hypothetical protein
MHLQQEELWEILSPDGKRQIGQKPEERDAGNDPDPQAALPLAEILRPDADDGAQNQGEPNEEQGKKHLAVEFCGFETQTVEDSAHLKIRLW